MLVITTGDYRDFLLNLLRLEGINAESVQNLEKKPSSFPAFVLDTSLFPRMLDDLGYINLPSKDNIKTELSKADYPLSEAITTFDLLKGSHIPKCYRVVKWDIFSSSPFQLQYLYSSLILLNAREEEVEEWKSLLSFHLHPKTRIRIERWLERNISYSVIGIRTGTGWLETGFLCLYSASIFSTGFISLPFYSFCLLIPLPIHHPIFSKLINLKIENTPAIVQLNLLLDLDTGTSYESSIHFHLKTPVIQTLLFLIHKHLRINSLLNSFVERTPVIFSGVYALGLSAITKDIISVYSKSTPEILNLHSITIPYSDISENIAIPNPTYSKDKKSITIDPYPIVIIGYGKSRSEVLNSIRNSSKPKIPEFFINPRFLVKISHTLKTLIQYKILKKEEVSEWI